MCVRVYKENPCTTYSAHHSHPSLTIVHMRVCVCVCVCVCACVCVCVCVCVCICIHLSLLCVFVCVHVCVYVYIYLSLYIYVYIYMYKYKYIYIHTHRPASVARWFTPKSHVTLVSRLVRERCWRLAFAAYSAVAYTFSHGVGFCQNIRFCENESALHSASHQIRDRCTLARVPLPHSSAHSTVHSTLHCAFCDVTSA